jgi:hypothetical protein
MLKRVTLPVLALLIVTFAGCGGSATKSPSASVAAPANVNGTWTGGTTTGASTITMVLKQTGTDVTGTLTGAGTLDGPIVGTVDGNTIRLSEASGFGSTPLLNVRGDQITGILRGTTVNLRRTSR